MSAWTAICPLADLEPERGVAALVDGVQVAVFLLHDGSLAAVDHRDPFSGANVLARGIVGSRGETPTVASPMYKQVFDLRTGRCLDDATPTVDGERREHDLRVHPVRVEAGTVLVAVQQEVRS